MGSPLALVLALFPGLAQAAPDPAAAAAPPRFPTEAELEAMALQYGERWTPEARVYRTAGPAVVTIAGYRRALSVLGAAAGVRGRPVTQASGVIIDASGFVLTNAHAVAPDESEPDDQLAVRVAFSAEFGGHGYDAELLSLDREWDLALLRIHGPGPFPALELRATDDVLIGERVIALGAPLGSSLSLTTGILSGIGRDILVQGMREVHRLSGVLQTDAAINPGNSGGPLLNAGGELIGITSATLTGAEGISYAIPAARARAVLESRLFRPRVWLGMGMLPQSLVVDRLHPRGPAALGGLRAGDRLLSLDETPLAGFSDLQRALLLRRPGERVTFAYERGQPAARGIARVDLEVEEARWTRGVLGFRPAEDTLPVPVPDQLSSSLVKILRVEEVFPGSGAAALGLTPGDTIIAVHLTEAAEADGWTPVQSREELRALVESGRFDLAGLNLWWLKSDGSSLKGRLVVDDPWLLAGAS